MSADITLSVQAYDRRHGWIDLPDALALGTADQRLVCNPEARDSAVFAVFGRPCQRFPTVTAAPFAHRRSPSNLHVDHPHHTAIGATWATVAELRAHHWYSSWTGYVSEFEQWLRQGVLDRIAVAYGADNVRVLVGFDS